MMTLLRDMLAGLAAGDAYSLSVALFDLTFLLCLPATGCYLIYLAWRRNAVWLAGFLLGIGTALGMTAALALRWVAAGWDHPPFTNMYEMMVFFVWGIIVFYLFAEARYKVRLAGAFVLPMACVALGLASLSPNKEIGHLMPALQSIWLHIHVAVASIGYAAFLTAFVFSVLFLFKDRVRLIWFTAVAAGFGVTALLLASGGAVLGGRYFATKVEAVQDVQGALLVTEADQDGAARGKLEAGRLRPTDAFDAQVVRNGQVVYSGKLQIGAPENGGGEFPFRLVGTNDLQTGDRLMVFQTIWEKAPLPGGRKGQYAGVSVPGIGPIMTVSLVLFLFTLLTAIPVGLRAQGEGQERIPLAALGAGFVSLTVASALLIVRVRGMETTRLSAIPYSLAMLALAWVAALLVLILYWRREEIAQALPAAKALDRYGYKAVMVGFPLMTLVIVTGAIWANQAWGRPWGWDPKETASLATWIIYLLYLHTRYTAGWTGRRSNLIAMIGFISVLFTFFGVNLVLNTGLHAYAKE